MERRFAGEIWLRDRLIWLPASRSMAEISRSRVAELHNFTFKIEYLKLGDNITSLGPCTFEDIQITNM